MYAKGTTALCALTILLASTLAYGFAPSGAASLGTHARTHVQLRKFVSRIPQISFLSSSAQMLGGFARPFAVSLLVGRSALGGMGISRITTGRPSGSNAQNPSIRLRAANENVKDPGGKDKGVQKPKQQQRKAPPKGGGGQPAINHNIDGIIAVNKPTNWTSFDVVNKVRGTLGRHIRELNPQLTHAQCRIKVGHGGTLDPAATGVLVIGIGKGTKLMEVYTKGSKSYKAVGVFGYETDTGDAEGKQAGEAKDFSHVTHEALDAACKKFEGDIMQVPPQYAAIKVDGRKAYELARKGVEVEMQPRQVSIHNVELIRPYKETAPAFDISVSCGGGTYIRSLVRDIARELGSAAHMASLQRTKQGEFDLGDCLSESQIFDAQAILDAIPKSAARLHSKQSPESP